MRRTTLVVGLAVAVCAGASAAAEDDSPTPSSSTTRLDEIVVEAKKPISAASSDEIEYKTFELRPHDTLMEVLNNIPGLLVRQHQGGGKAPQWLIRGFNADHGTDFLVQADGVPVNLVSHGHGQGYADPNFVIPETLETLHVRKGPYFPELGDFDVAGALNMVTLTEFPEDFALGEFARFDRYRAVLGASPRIGPVKTLLAAQAYFSQGPFINDEHFRKYNAYMKFTLDPTPTSRVWAAGTFYSADWDASGQIPSREVSAGRLDRFGAIDPSEGGRTDREIVDIHYDARPTAADEWNAQAWMQRYTLKLYSNFTFYQDSVFQVSPGDLAANPGAFPTGFALDPRGDGLEQDDSRYVYGGQVRYSRYYELFGTPQATRVGLQMRADDIDVALYRQDDRSRYFTISTERVRERAYSAYVAQEIFFTDWIRFEGGVRSDTFTFDVRNQQPKGQNRRVPASFIPEQPINTNLKAFPIDGNETASQVSPKANLIITPRPQTDIYLNFGRGFHSNDARAAVQAEDDPDNTPLASALGAEIGARTKLLDRIDTSAAFWWLDLDSEIVFCGDCGTISDEPRQFDAGPASRRYGIDFTLLVPITDWLTGDYDLSWAHPRFKNGDNIPVAPTLLMNGGLTAAFANGFSASLRTKFLDDRPGTEDGRYPARGFGTTDLITKYRWKQVELGFDVLNIFNQDWQEAVFIDTSCTLREARNAVAQGRFCASPNDAHFTPGDPTVVRGRVTIFF